MKAPDYTYDYLRSQGYIGAIPDMLEAYYRANGATGTTFPELEMAWLAAKGFTQPTLNERWYAYLYSLGFRGNVVDMYYQAVRAGTAYGPPPFSPLEVFAASAPGLWWDFGDMSKLYRFADKLTPVTTAGDTVGVVEDKSGRGNDSLGGGSTLRPIYQTGPSRAVFDGTDDARRTATTTMTMTASMDLFIVLKRTVDNVAILFTGENGDVGFFAITAPAGFETSPHSDVVGSPTYVVNGTEIAGATRSSLGAALPLGSWKVLEIRNLDFATDSWAWGQLGFSRYVGNAFAGEVVGILLCNSQDSTMRGKIRTYLGAQAGLTL